MTRLEAALEMIRLVDIELVHRAAGIETPAYMSRRHHAVTSTYIALSRPSAAGQRTHTDTTRRHHAHIY